MWIGWDRSGRRDKGSWREVGLVFFIIAISGSDCSRSMKHEKMIIAYHSLLNHVEISGAF